MIHYNIKYKCRGCHKILCKKELDELNTNIDYSGVYPRPLRDYMWNGHINEERIAVQHGKDETYFSHGCPGIEEIVCDLMVPLDENNRPISCTDCQKEYGIYEVENKYFCLKCIGKRKIDFYK